MATLRPLIFSTILGALTFYLYHQHLSTSTPFWRLLSMSYAVPLSRFLTRGTPLSPATPLLREHLKLAVLRNAPVETDGFTLALFEPGVAVTHYGAVVKLNQGDYDGILALAAQISTLPSPERFYNTWVIDQPRTSQPIERILVPRGTLSSTPEERYGDEYREVSVQGYEKGKTELKEEVAGYRELPSVLEELVGVVLEGRLGEGEKNDEVVARVKGILGAVY